MFIDGPGQIRVGEEARYRVIATLSNGSRIDVTDADDLEVSTTIPFLETRPPGNIIKGMYPGVARLSVRYRGVTDTREVVVLPEEPTFSPFDVIVTNTELIEFDHVVGTTPCPQVVEGVIVTNITDAPITVTVSSDTIYLAVDRSQFTVPPGGRLRVPLLFLCETASAFDDFIEIRAVSTSSGRVQHRQVLVRGHIRR